LEERVQPGMRTLETGAGATTIVFAAGGSQHQAITPAADEVERIRQECARLRVNLELVDFVLGLSEEVLPNLAPPPLDIVLVGGADGFPYPILDWWYLAPHLRVGGHLLVDAAYNPAAAALVDHLRADSAWRFDSVLGYRTVLVEKVGTTRPRPLFAGDPAIGRPSFRYLPPARRARASTRHRIFTTRAGLALVGWTRRHAPWLWTARR
jgi:precorrin-6B methylase 2